MQRAREAGKLPLLRNGPGWPSRMLTKSASFVPSSLRCSTYQKYSRRSETLEGLFRSPRSIARANGSHEVRFVPPSPLLSLRPYLRNGASWTLASSVEPCAGAGKVRTAGFLSILRSVFPLSKRDRPFKVRRAHRDFSQPASAVSDGSTEYLQHHQAGPALTSSFFSIVPSGNTRPQSCARICRGRNVRFPQSEIAFKDNFLEE
jgi:hypothetical protein